MEEGKGGVSYSAGAAITKCHRGDFPGGPVVKTSLSSAGGVGSIPGQGAKIPHALGPKKQNTKQEQYCNKFNKDLKKKKSHRLSGL